MTQADLNQYLVTSPDLTKERIETLRSLFPDLFTNEGELNPIALRQLVAGDEANSREQYAFAWRGKARAKRHAFTPSRAALTYDPDRSVNPAKADGNMIIEGENLEVLKLLTSAYRGKVKCIYIDPPYNTGGDFIYPDNYTRDRREYWEENGSYKDGVKMDSNPETSGRYHSDWLSMMYSRLLVARQLLKDDGVIFVSIDDNEVHNLRKIMDEIFGEESFVAVFPWRKRTAKSDVPYGVSQDYEWILVYANEKFLAGHIVERRYQHSDDYDEGWRLADLTTQRTKEERPNSFFPMVDPKSGIVYEANPNRVWGVTKDTFQDYYDRGKIVFPGDYKFLNITIPAFRVFESEDRSKNNKKFGHEDPLKPASTMLPKDIGRTEDGTKEITDIFGQKVFPFPKPTSLIRYLLSLIPDKKFIVLDFFAGSGPTAHAVMQLNEEDGGQRKYILVQIPEKVDRSNQAFAAGYKTISAITVERNRRVIKGYGDNPQPLDTGFKVYRLTKSHFPRAEFQPDPDKSDEENIQALKDYIALKEASFQMTFDQDKIFDEVLLKHGFTLDYTLSKQEEFGDNIVYLADDGTRQAYICLDMGLRDSTIEMFKGRTERPFICLERALDTTKKWNLKHALGDRLKAV